MEPSRADGAQPGYIELTLRGMKQSANGIPFAFARRSVWAEFSINCTPIELAMLPFSNDELRIGRGQFDVVTFPISASL